jgi:two-component system response regulator
MNLTRKIKTILLVEDDADDEVLTSHALTSSGVEIEIVAVRDGAQALDFLFGEGAYIGRDVTDQPALVLLEVNLPRVSGMEVLSQVRADPRTHRVPVVVLTSSKREVDIIASYERGANSFVRKPIDFEEFSKVARNLCTYWLRLNETAPAARASMVSPPVKGS